MEWLILIVILLALVGVALKVLFWVFVGRKVIELGRNVEEEFFQHVQQLNSMLRYAEQHRGSNEEVQLPPQFFSQLMQAQNEFSAMDRIAQEKHETFVGGMLSDASAAGVDVSNWNTRSW